MENLSGHIAIISGGLGDIGRAIARELAQRGADIAVGDILEEEKATAFLEELRGMGRRARYDRADVSDAAAVTAWVNRVESEMGVPDLIIPNAAVVTLKGILEVTPDEWRRELEVNLDGAFHMAQACAKRLRYHQKPGRIVFIGSWVAHAPQRHIPAYCVTKAGLRMLCKCMAIELAPHGILVNEVAPGNVDAGLSAQLFRIEPSRREKAARPIPVRKMSLPEDIALHVAHLCDPRNEHVTGSVLLVDGGLSLVNPGTLQEEG